MKHYHKIENIFNRDMEGNKKLIEGNFRNATIEYLSDFLWECTEKIDGTNIGIVWNGHEVSYIGRTERSDIPSKLVTSLNAIFQGNTPETIFEQLFGEKQAILYGEGYGGKIQKVGGNYRPDESFILFDVYFPESDVYAKRAFVEEVAKAFGIAVTPIVLRGTLSRAVEYIKSKPKSLVSDQVMEGVVARPAVELKDNQGRRILVKIKVEDFE